MDTRDDTPPPAPQLAEDSSQLSTWAGIALAAVAVALLAQVVALPGLLVVAAVATLGWAVFKLGSVAASTAGEAVGAVLDATVPIDAPARELLVTRARQLATWAVWLALLWAVVTIAGAALRRRNGRA